MRKLNWLFVMMFLVALGLSACEKKGPMERAGENIDNAAHNAGDAVEDAGDKIEDAADRAQ